MTRSEIIDALRAECPDITENVVSDVTCNSWLLVGDKEVSTKTRCIQKEASFTSVTSTSIYDTKYDLTNSAYIGSKFFDIDEYPGGGVIYDDDRLDVTTIAQLDEKHKSWRTRSAGTPEKYYLRGQYLYFDYPVETASTVRVYYVGISDDFNNDDILPFNQLTHLTPFHYSLVLYLKKRAKRNRGKEQEAAIAQAEYDDYISWMKKEVNRIRTGPVFFKPRI